MHKDIPIKGGVNDCHWNIDGICSNWLVSTNERKIIATHSRNWESRIRCPLTQLGVHLCSEYIHEGLK